VVRALSPRSYWIAWGALAGTIYGTGYGWLAWQFVGEGPGLAPVLGSGCLGAAIGAVFAARYRATGPTETNLCTWLGMLLGAVPVLGLFLLVVGSAHSKLSVYALAAFAFAPIAAGLLVGGFLDRLSEGILFRDPVKDEPPT
jgi:hypothetical protein